MAEIHDFDDTVVAVIPKASDLDSIAAELAAAGYEYELIQGESGKRHIDPDGAQGVGATVKRLLNAFGDQYRIIEKLNDELDDGRTVVSVAAKPDEAGEAVRILDAANCEFIWKLGSWTYTQVSD